MANPNPLVRFGYFAFVHFFKYFPYVDLMTAVDVIGGNANNFLCAQGVRLVACQLLSFVYFGGDPLNPLKSNTDKVKFFGAHIRGEFDGYFL